jgi:glycosyltransferase involved in cell wall biosynthesis
MHILYDHQIFTWQRYGGISRYYYELITHLCKEPGIDVSLFLGFHVNEFAFGCPHHGFKYYFGVKRPAYPKFNKVSKLVNNTLFSSLTAVNLRADIYHQTYYSNLASRFLGKRIVTVPDMIHEIFPHYFLSRDKTARKKKVAIDNADGIICTSQSTKIDLMQCYRVPEQKIRVIYLGNSLQSEVTSPRLIDESYILYVGFRGLYKSFIMLLHAYAHSPRINQNYKVICFGGGPFSKHECQEIISMGVLDKVIQIDGNDDILANLYQYASVFVYPSQYEGFGLPLLESMHYGCPILTSNTSSIPEVVGQAGLYFDPTSEEDLAAKLDLILHNSTLRDQLCQRGFQQEKKFSWEQCEKETVSFYKDILSDA